MRGVLTKVVPHETGASTSSAPSGDANAVIEVYGDSAIFEIPFHFVDHERARDNEMTCWMLASKIFEYMRANGRVDDVFILAPFIDALGPTLRTVFSTLGVTCVFKKTPSTMTWKTPNVATWALRVQCGAGGVPDPDSFVFVVPEGYLEVEGTD